MTTFFPILDPKTLRIDDFKKLGYGMLVKKKIFEIINHRAYRNLLKNPGDTSSLKLSKSITLFTIELD
jgi:hypothetical protein